MDDFNLQWSMTLWGPHFCQANGASVYSIKVTLYSWEFIGRVKHKMIDCKVCAYCTE